ncbi:hypothetical protein [Microvirga sp. P5_D2]
METAMSSVWAEIETQYADGVPVAALARQFNLSRARITRRAKKLGWARRATCGGPEGSYQSLRDRLAASSQELEAAMSPADQRAALLRRHKAAWAALYPLREEVFRVLIDPEMGTTEQRLSHSARLQALFEKDARALKTAQEGERRAYGICYKQQQEAGPADEAEVQRKRELARSVIDMVQSMKDQVARCTCTKEAS